MFHWAKVRHDEAAERTLLTAVGSGLTREELNRMIFEPIQERIYADKGHALDLSNKAFELLEFIGWEYATEVLPLIVEHLTQSRSEEEQGTWRAPVDLVRSFTQPRRRYTRSRQGREEEPCVRRISILKFLEKTLRRFLEPLLKQCITVFRRSMSHDIWHSRRRGAWRVSRSPTISKIGSRQCTLFRSAMRFIGCWHGGKQGQLVRGLFHAAMSIYVDRFLNIPRAQLPSEQPLENLPSGADELRETLLSALNQRKEWSEVPRLALRYLRLNHPEAKFIDTLTFATVREDLDFHSLQVLEAGLTQAAEWPPASAERELLYAAICRHLAAHCPTRRSSSQSVAVALRLQKGEEVYAQ